MTVVAFSMAGPPRGQGRPRATVRGGAGRAFASMYKHGDDRKYEASIAKIAAERMDGGSPLVGALSVSLQFRMPIPASATKKAKAAMAAGETPHLKKPDIDNLAKAIFDGLNGVVFADDCQIVRSFITKIYSERPGVDVRVEALEPQDIA